MNTFEYKIRPYQTKKYSGIVIEAKEDFEKAKEFFKEYLDKKLELRYQKYRKIVTVTYDPWHRPGRITINDANLFGPKGIFKSGEIISFSLLPDENALILYLETEVHLSFEDMSRKYGPGGESDKHLKLKDYIANHPEKIGLNREGAYKLEYLFPTGDRADILFINPDGKRYVIEIEISGEDNLLIGAKQLIKYRALDLVEIGQNLNSDSCKAILVAYSMNGNKLEKFCQKYDIQCYGIIPESIR